MAGHGSGGRIVGAARAGCQPEGATAGASARPDRTQAGAVHGALRGPVRQASGLTAIASISTLAPFGSAATAIVERAGGGSVTNRP